MQYIFYNGELYHHGVQGQKWGVRNAEWYPIDEWKASQKSGRDSGSSQYKHAYNNEVAISDFKRDPGIRSKQGKTNYYSANLHTSNESYNLTYWTPKNDKEAAKRVAEVESVLKNTYKESAIQNAVYDAYKQYVEEYNSSEYVDDRIRITACSKSELFKDLRCKPNYVSIDTDYTGKDSGTLTFGFYAPKVDLENDNANDYASPAFVEVTVSDADAAKILKKKMDLL